MPKPLKTFDDVQGRALSLLASMQISYGVNQGKAIYDLADAMAALATRCMELERTVRELRDQLGQAKDENALAHAQIFREMDIGEPGVRRRMRETKGGE